MRVQVRAQSDVLHRKGNKGDERTYDVMLLYLKSCIEGEQSSQTANTTQAKILANSCQYVNQSSQPVNQSMCKLVSETFTHQNIIHPVTDSVSPISVLSQRFNRWNLTHEGPWHQRCSPRPRPNPSKNIRVPNGALGHTFRLNTDPERRHLKT